MPTLGPALARNPGFADLVRSTEAAATIEAFRAAPIKIAFQKGGVLTDVSVAILAEYGFEVPPEPEKSRLDISVSNDGQVGFVRARNKAICELVASGAVNLAIVGTDRLIEDGAEDKVDIVASFEDRFAWPLVLATPNGSPAQSIADINVVASQYPIITSRFFAAQGCPDVQVIPSAGGTELYPYLTFEGRAIDAVVDLVSTGQTMAEHQLSAWEPAIGTVYPVLIQSRQS